jgi:uncharacterized membrane protein
VPVKPRTRDFLLYVAIGAAVMVAMVISVVLIPHSFWPNSTYRWFAFAFSTGLLGIALVTM